MNARDNFTDGEYAQAFEIAKRALQYVGTFKTPPTPDVYEIWFRFAEGADEALIEQLAFAVNELKQVDKRRIEEIRQQFFSQPDSKEEDAKLSDDLAGELGGLQSVINESMAASDEFSDSVSSISENLSQSTDASQLKVCVETLLSSKEKMELQLRAVHEQLERSQQHVDMLRANLLESQKFLMTDPLTGVGNRRLFDVIIRQAVCEPAQNGKANTLMLVDLDNFKDVNDTYGHAAGDEVLKFAASEMKRMAVHGSIVRYGGDEFAVFAKRNAEGQEQELADQICQFFKANKLTLKKTGETLGQVTVSLGVATLRRDDDTESWFERADSLLYSAKQSGRGCAMVEGRK